MQLNSSFISNIKDLYGELGITWMKKLPTDINQLCERYGLNFIKIMPNLTYHFIGLVAIAATGEKAILKMAPTNENMDKEAQWLQCFDKAVPKVFWYDEAQYALLMEYLVPGESLKSLVSVDDDKATRIICRTINRLQSHQKKTNLLHFKHLSMLEKNFLILDGRIEKKMLSQAVSWFRGMTSERSNDVLLHGDLHHDNILSHGADWKVIDPHGYTGDPVFEVGPMIYNPRGDYFPTERTLSQIIERRLKIIAEELPFDAQRIKTWAFCMTMLSIAWTVEDHGYIPEFELKVAHIINDMSV